MASKPSVEQRLKRLEKRLDHIYDWVEDIEDNAEIRIVRMSEPDTVSVVPTKTIVSWQTSLQDLRDTVGAVARLEKLCEQLQERVAKFDKKVEAVSRLQYQLQEERKATAAKVKAAHEEGYKAGIRRENVVYKEGEQPWVYS